ncbi:MAG: LysR family transcriptional regulator [Lachnospiraceae bacterium]|nr:LysR family transcriptional regulator [Lachnospiraceae bacterium]
MTLEQLRYLCCIYEAGSINQASKLLYLSQPSLSSAVRKLEGELGFEILRRRPDGVEFTDRGLILLRYARRVTEECASISSIGSKKQRFRIISPRYSPVEEAFSRLCGELMAEGSAESLDLALFSADWEEALTTLSEMRAELAAAIIPGRALESPLLRSHLSELGLVVTEMRRIPLSIKLSASHPLLSEEPFPFEKLADYPFVEYTRNPNLPPPAVDVQNLPLIQVKNRIAVDAVHTRTRLIAATTAWGICAKLSSEHEEKAGIRYVDIPDTTLVIALLRDGKRVPGQPEARFIELLREQLAQI